MSVGRRYRRQACTGIRRMQPESYNPTKPGRPSHGYHCSFIASLRIVLEVEVQAGTCQDVRAILLLTKEAMASIVSKLATLASYASI